MVERLLDALFRTAGMSYTRMAVALLFSTLLGLYIFFVYRSTAKESFYSKSFNMTLPVITVLTTAIVVAMQANLVVSLGMVGALSIVRFRTALKDPMDLAYIFWAITTGIISGTEIYGLAFLTALIATAAIFLLDRINLKAAPRLLVVNGADKMYEADLEKILKDNRVKFTLKSRNINKAQLDLIYEIQAEDGQQLVRDISDLSSVMNVSILDHDGSLRH